MLPPRTVQVHVTRRCNLRCAHCYSESGPDRSETLDVETLLRFLARARELGYDTLSLSGGEPFLYPDLERLLEGARSQSWRVTAVTNGTLFGNLRARRALDGVDVVGVSVDGPPALHDRIRRHPRAYERMLAGLATLREAGKPFALVHTLTRSSLESLVDLVELAQREGAGAIRFHPLEAIGGGTGLDTEALDGRDRAIVYLAVAGLRADPDVTIPIELDLVNRELVQAPCDAFLERPLAEALSPLVVTPAGELLPFAFGVDPSLSLGQLADGPAALDRASDRLPAIRRVLVRAAELCHREPWPFLDWFAALTRASREAGGMRTASPRLRVLADRPPAGAPASRELTPSVGA